MISLAIVYHEFTRSCGVGRALVEPLKFIDKDIKVTLIGQDFDEDLAKYSKLVYIPMFQNSLLNKIAFSFQVSWYLRSHSFDVVHRLDSGFFKSDIISSQFLYSHWHHFVNSHQNYFSRQFVHSILKSPKSIYIRLTEKYQHKSNKVRYIFSPSVMCSKHLFLYYQISAHKVLYITNGYDPEKFHINDNKSHLRLRYKFPADKYIFLFCGSNYERKGLFTLLQAIEVLKNQSKQFLVILAGFDSKQILVQQKIKEMGLADYVVCVGFIKEIELFYQLADAYVLPSFYDPCPNSVYEAIASGIPVIISENCGQSDWIKDGINGLVIKDVFSYHELAEKMSLLLGNPSLSKCFIINNQKQIKNFQWKQIADRLSNLYLSISKKEAVS